MLEHIKQKITSLGDLVDSGSVNISLLNDFNWLIQQVEEKQEGLKEIENITEGLTLFNPTYEKIYNIAINAIGGNEDD